MTLQIVSTGCISALLLFGLGACAVPDALQRREAAQVYMLDPQRKTPAVPPGAGQKPKIAVAVPQAWPGFDSVEIAYILQPNRINYYAHSEWADAPARMIGPLLVRALEENGRFGAVVSAGSGVMADLRLDTEIVKMQQEFGTSPSVGRIVVRAQLVNLATGQVLGTRTFQATAPAPTEDPAGGVMAMNRALSDVFDQIVSYCGEIAAALAEKNG